MSVRIDLHTHSRHGSFDGRRSYDEIAEENRAKGIDVVVITEHDTPTEPEVLAEISDRYGVLFLPGIELSFGDWGHFLVLGGENFLKRQAIRRYDKTSVMEVLGRVQDNLREISGNYLKFDDFMSMMSEMRALFKENLLNPIEFSQAARTHGAYVSWAHPFVATPLRKTLDKFLANGGNLDIQKFILYLKEGNPQVLEVVSAVDAIEGLNGLDQGLLSHLASLFAYVVGKPMTAGSDGHREGEFGTALMSIDCGKDDITDIPSLIRVLRTHEWKIQSGGSLS